MLRHGRTFIEPCLSHDCPGTKGMRANQGLFAAELSTEPNIGAAMLDSRLSRSVRVSWPPRAVR
jgi:hypothetical protein